MEPKGFKKISELTASETYGGSGLVFISSLLQIIIPAISSLIVSFKLLFSNKGEIKAKDGTTSKWDTYIEKTNNTNEIHFIK